MTILVNNEFEFRMWFENNYDSFGFQKIIKRDEGVGPDFVMLKDGREVVVELEILSSNFELHKHSLSDIDEVICVKQDKELQIHVREAKGVKWAGIEKADTPYLVKNQILELMQSSEKEYFSTSDMSSQLELSWHTIDRACLKLQLDGKIDGFKIGKMNLWRVK